MKNVRVDSVGLGVVQAVSDEDAAADGKDVGVKVVVDKVELLGRCQGLAVRSMERGVR